MLGVRIVLAAILASFAWGQEPLQKPPAAIPMAGQPVITIIRSGGFAGVDDEVSIFADGKVLDRAGKVRHIPPAKLSGFIQAVETVGTAGTPHPRGTVRDQCSDCFTYAVKIREGDTFKNFVLQEPIRDRSGKNATDIRVVREFLAIVFGVSK